MRSRTIQSGRSPAAPCVPGILSALLLAIAVPSTALEPNDLRPGMDMMAVASVYTSHRSCGNYEFREQPQSIGWDATLYGRRSRVEIHFEDGLATSVLILLELQSGEDGHALFAALTEERNRDLGKPLPRSPAASALGTSGQAGGVPEVAVPVSVVWSRDGHLIHLKRWPLVPRGEIHLLREHAR